MTRSKTRFPFNSYQLKNPLNSHNPEHWHIMHASLYNPYGGQTLGPGHNILKGQFELEQANYIKTCT
jgi:hypothetical protein